MEPIPGPRGQSRPPAILFPTRERRGKPAVGGRASGDDRWHSEAGGERGAASNSNQQVAEKEVEGVSIVSV